MRVRVCVLCGAKERERETERATDAAACRRETESTDDSENTQNVYYYVMGMYVAYRRTIPDPLGLRDQIWAWRNQGH